jgi:RNA polymerase sigma-70 factor (ECF subfamily)
MKGVCLRYAQTSFEAEDLMHDGFVKVFRHLGSFKFECPLGAWIRKIMVNTALSYYRQKRHQTEFAELEILVNVAEPEPEMQHLAAEELMEMVRSLPDKYRLVFNLFGIEGYSHKEIAELLGITEVTSRSQFLRARHLLREMVNQEDKIRYEKIS